MRRRSLASMMSQQASRANARGSVDEASCVCLQGKREQGSAPHSLLHHRIVAEVVHVASAGWSGVRGMEWRAESGGQFGGVDWSWVELTRVEHSGLRAS